MRWCLSAIAVKDWEEFPLCVRLLLDCEEPGVVIVVCEAEENVRVRGLLPGVRSRCRGVLLE